MSYKKGKKLSHANANYLLRKLARKKFLRLRLNVTTRDELRISGETEFHIMVPL